MQRFRFRCTDGKKGVVPQSVYSRTDSSLEGSSAGSTSGSMSPGAFHSCTEPLPMAIKNVAVARSTAEETPKTNRHHPANLKKDSFKLHISQSILYC